MQTRSVVVLVGFAISLVLPTFAQQKDAVQPQLRQEIEAALMKFEEAFNKHDAAAMATLFTLDAVQMLDWGEGGTFSGQQAIEKHYALDFASSPPEFVEKLIQVLCNRRQDIRYFRMESREVERLSRKDLCS